MKIFEMPVQKIFHSPTYLESDAAHKCLKKKGELDEEKKREEQRLENEMRAEMTIEERLQTEGPIVAIRLGMEVSHVLSCIAIRKCTREGLMETYCGRFREI